ncbi:AraC family transcriptional regulator [Spirosoma taeanense]|uniref:AraC family transcriptional regulator n=1 Tax=Spirosoma taeanense TaxID=2735870 RepID=A0A6M5Y7G3_9BACT|nr:helix-turn-helix domain-containing protein [Spirosoma taeanense]QJW89414.1 AraC family transcriptional regulator [Spirosoma taeanense]
MNIFDYRPPSPALWEYVRLYQIVGFSFPDTVEVPVKPYWPRAENYLTFHPRNPIVVEHINGSKEIWKPRSLLIGQATGITNRQPLHDFVLFQIVFQPGALFRLTGIPAHELANTFVDAEAVFAPEINLVNERLSSTDNHLEMISIVEAFLHYQIRRRSTAYSRHCQQPIDRVSQFLLQSPSPFVLDWLADQACLSTRQFYNLFVQRMGISPKLYARIARFDQTVKLKNAQPTKDWLSIALELGYYDYQHLVRDYKEFTKLTPSKFCQRESNAPERTFGKAET